METKGQKIFFYIIALIVSFFFFVIRNEWMSILYNPILSKKEKIKKISALKNYFAADKRYKTISNNWKFISSDSDANPAVWKAI